MRALIQGLQDLVTSTYLVVGGIKDALYIWKQIPWVLSNPRTTSCTTWIFLGSIGVCLALWLLLDKVIEPMGVFINVLLKWNQEDAVREIEGISVIALTWKALLNLALLLPILSVCNKAISKWYQKLSDLVFIDVKHLDTDALVKTRSKQDVRYCDTMSLVCAIYTNLIATALPQAVDYAESLSTKTLGILLPRTVHFAFYLLRKYMMVKGITYQCLYYSWLAANFHWITAGVGPGTRFDIVERRWEYFLGFGLPVVLLMRAFTWVPLSFGVYFLLMPFMVITVNTTEYSRDYKYLAATVEYVTGPDFNPNNLSPLEKLLAFFLHKTESSHRYISPTLRGLDPKRNHRAATRFHLGRFYPRIRAFKRPHGITNYILELTGSSKEYEETSQIGKMEKSKNA